MVEGKKLEDLSSDELIELFSEMHAKHRETANKATANILANVDPATAKEIDASASRLKDMLGFPSR